MNWGTYLVGMLLLAACVRPAPEPSGSLAAQSNVECPATITVEQRFVGSAGAWEAGLGSGEPRLAGVTFYDGPPREMASLVNDEESQTQDTWTGIWRFTPAGGRGHWVACSYTHTNVVLSRRLPPVTSECRVTYATDVAWAGGGRVVREMRCR